jgi:Kef-type K+ transport system membrane component KefB
VAIIGKVGGGSLGARLAKFNKEQCLSIGFLMNGRGMVELVIASIGFSAGILDIKLFSVAVAIGVITTIMAPVLARSFIERSKNKTKYHFLEEANNFKKTS